MAFRTSVISSEKHKLRMISIIPIASSYKVLPEMPSRGRKVLLLYQPSQYPGSVKRCEYKSALVILRQWILYFFYDIVGVTWTSI